MTQPLREAPDLEKRVSINERFSFEKAIIAQEKFSSLVKKRSALPKKMSCVAGVDVAYSGQLSYTSAVLMDYKTLKPIEIQYVRNLVKVPYRSGFLGFREAAFMVEAVQKLKTQPDAILVDGHGLAHPRGFGLACHVGVMLDLPTIGVAKSIFYGEVDGNWVLDESGHKIAATINANKRTLYVSVGHKVSLKTAIQVTRHCMVTSLPEPLRLAHQEATRMARKIET